MNDTDTTRPTTLVLGATPNPSRYAYAATRRLQTNDHPVVLVGIKDGEIGGVPIQKGTPELEEEIDTVTLYVGARHQPPYYDFLLDLKPRRIIFNPGTENPELYRMAWERDIEPISACTLVMLATGEY